MQKPYLSITLSKSSAKATGFGQPPTSPKCEGVSAVSAADAIVKHFNRINLAFLQIGQQTEISGAEVPV